MFILFIILLVLAAIAAGIWIIAKPAEEKTVTDRWGEKRTVSTESIKVPAGIAALVLGLLAGIFLVFSSLTIVPANHVGVVTNFGSWSGTVDSGAHWVKPWSKIDTFTTRNNKSIRDQAEGNGPCVTIKAKGNASGCMDLTVLYTIDKNNAEVLWRGWGSFDRLNSDLVDRATDNSANLVTSNYAPSDFPAVRAEMTQKMHDELSREIGVQGVHLESITLGDVHWPDNVQKNINDILAADAQVQVAQRNQQSAEAEARANAARQQSLTPEALIKACLDAAKEIKPQYFDCGLGNVQNKPSVILGGERR